MSKQKTMIFVDTENIGHSIPNKIPKSIKVYFYIKDKNILPKVYPNCMQKQIKLIDLATRSTKTKNEMDLALVTQLSIAIAGHKKKRKYVVLSNDKGYDYPIYLLRKSYGVQLCRVCCSLKEYIDPLEEKEESEPKKEEIPVQEIEISKKNVQDTDEENYSKALFKKYDDFEKYRKAQKPGQKKRFRKYRQMYDGGSKIWIEFDPYTNMWVPFLSGVRMEEIKADVDPKIVSAKQTKWIEKNGKV
ncbi:hypothetical protein C815_01520 [Firmicutes bacterium M10-2]|nr:hypothetical protein C815_01520 [Firmicutes bacterium M10-2]